MKPSKKRKVGSTKKNKKRTTRVIQLNFNYPTRCDYKGCGARARKGKELWAYKNRLGVMEARCKQHLKKPPTKKRSAKS